MTTFTESTHAGEYLVHEPHVGMCRKKVTIASSAKLNAGTVLGQVTASGKYIQLNLSATTGEAVAKAILFDTVDASAADAPGIITARLTLVNKSALVWPTGITDNQKATALGEMESDFIIGQ